MTRKRTDDPESERLRRAFLQRLRDRMEELGWLQSEFARRVGVDPSTVTGWYRDAQLPNAEIVVRACKVMGLSAHWLLLGAGKRLASAGNEEGDAGSLELIYRAGGMAMLARVERVILDAFAGLRTPAVPAAHAPNGIEPAPEPAARLFEGEYDKRGVLVRASGACLPEDWVKENVGKTFEQLCKQSKDLTAEEVAELQAKWKRLRKDGAPAHMVYTNMEHKVDRHLTLARKPNGHVLLRVFAMSPDDPALASAPPR